MRKVIWESGVKVWLSAEETRAWATRPGESWPCSTLRGKRLFAEYDRNGLCDLAINGRMRDCDAGELDAIVSDHLRGRLPAGHPCACFFN